LSTFDHIKEVENSYDWIAFVVETLMLSNAFEQPERTASPAIDLMCKFYGKHAGQTGFKLDKGLCLV